MILASFEGLNRREYHFCLFHEPGLDTVLIPNVFAHTYNCTSPVKYLFTDYLHGYKTNDFLMNMFMCSYY